MRVRNLRARMARVALVGAAVLPATFLVSTRSASALSTPSGYPRWFVGAPQTIRDAGSDTTFFMMQQLSDLFEQAGLYGCQLSLTPTPNYSTCNTGGDIATTDTTDNYDRVEVTTGIDQIGSGEGQKQLCGIDTSPFPVDFSRSSKPPSSCPTLVGEGFAKDGVPGIDFPHLEGPNVTAGSYFGNQVVGPVAAGWLPGDPVTCDTGAPGSSSNSNNTVNGCSGVPFSNISNTGGTASTAWRLYCSTDNTSGAPDQRITDWGQLTNLTGSTPVGSGTAIGIPVTIIGVNPASGTEATYAHYVDSGQTTGGNDSCANTNTNQSSLMSGQALENDAAQIPDFATAATYPGGDTGTKLQADQDAFVQTALYYMANGVYNANAYSRAATINGLGTVGAKLNENGVAPTTSVPNGTLWKGTYPTARILYNIYNTNTLRASVADFLDWICGTNTDGVFSKGKDLSTGNNYDSEVTTTIQNTFGFIRITDTSASPNNACPLINIPPSVNDGVETSGSPNISSATGFAQSGQVPVQVGDLVTGAGIPAGTYVKTITDSNDLVLTNNASATASGVTFNFNIHSPTS